MSIAERSWGRGVWGGAYGLAEKYLRERSFESAEALSGLLTEVLDKWDGERNGYVVGREAKRMRGLVAEELGEVNADPCCVFERADVIIVANRLANSSDASEEDVKYANCLIERQVSWLRDWGQDPVKVCMRAVMKNCANYPEAMFCKDGAGGTEASYLLIKRMRKQFSGSRLPMFEEYKLMGGVLWEVGGEET